MTKHTAVIYHTVREGLHLLGSPQKKLPSGGEEDAATRIPVKYL